MPNFVRISTFVWFDLGICLLVLVWVVFVMYFFNLKTSWFVMVFVNELILFLKLRILKTRVFIFVCVFFCHTRQRNVWDNIYRLLLFYFTFFFAPARCLFKSLCWTKCLEEQFMRLRAPKELSYNLLRLLSSIHYLVFFSFLFKIRKKKKTQFNYKSLRIYCLCVKRIKRRQMSVGRTQFMKVSDNILVWVCLLNTSRYCG